MWTAISPDRDALVFVRAGLSHQDVYAIGLSNDLRPVGEAKRITFTKPFNRQPASGLSVSPDRRSILFSKREDKGLDLMLAENFR